MNLTAALERACAELREKKHFNGVPVVQAKVESEEEKRRDAARDGLSREATERYVMDYACVTFCLDTSTCCASSSQYESVEFDCKRLLQDFRQWLLQFVDESVLPRWNEIDISGGDTEIMKPGYKLEPCKEKPYGKLLSKLEAGIHRCRVRGLSGFTIDVMDAERLCEFLRGYESAEDENKLQNLRDRIADMHEETTREWRNEWGSHGRSSKRDRLYGSEKALSQVLSLIEDMLDAD